MITQENDFVLNDGELFELAEHLQPKNSRLAILPRQRPALKTAVLQEYSALAPEKQAELDEIIRGLAHPMRLLRLHYSVADETISRQFIVWPGASDAVVTLARNGDVWRASQSTEFGVRSLVEEILGAGSSLRRDPFALGLSSMGVMVFLGVMEQMKYARLYSTLMSQDQDWNFTPEDILERMRQSVKEDFRWPLAMFEKVLPVEIMEVIAIEDVTRGLAELVKLELVEAVDDQGRIFELSDSGRMVADGILHEVSKAALCVTQCREDGVIGHDAALLVRASFYLFLFEISGEAGALAALDAEETDEYLKKTFEVPTPEIVAAAYMDSGTAQPEASEESQVPAAARTLAGQAPGTPARVRTLAPAEPAAVCSNCGKPLGAEARFCQACGQPVAAPARAPAAPSVQKVCPNCGNPVRDSAKFCRSCGKPV